MIPNSHQVVIHLLVFPSFDITVGKSDFALNGRQNGAKSSTTAAVTQ